VHTAEDQNEGHKMDEATNESNVVDLFKASGGPLPGPGEEGHCCACTMEEDIKKGRAAVAHAPHELKAAVTAMAYAAFHAVLGLRDLLGVVSGHTAGFDCQIETDMLNDASRAAAFLLDVFDGDKRSDSNERS
jgi:hypothetical protein